MQVYVEATDKKAFACAVDWPGWCRSGKNEGAALEQLIDYTDRYAEVARLAKVRFTPGEPRVVERIPGNATTTFGAPNLLPELDTEAKPTDIDIALLQASWQLLDDVATKAPAELPKGPRGGGRDRDEILQHVVAAEAAYARKIGVKHKTPQFGDRAAVAAMHADIVAALSGGVADGAWPLRFFVRRTAWHVLDHAWELEDKSA